MSWELLIVVTVREGSTQMYWSSVFSCNSMEVVSSGSVVVEGIEEAEKGGGGGAPSGGEGGRKRRKRTRKALVSLSAGNCQQISAFSCVAATTLTERTPETISWDSFKTS